MGMGIRARPESRRGRPPPSLKYDGTGATDDFQGCLQIFFKKLLGISLKNSKFMEIRLFDSILISTLHHEPSLDRCR
jgi:hypothetical protein